MGVMAMFYPIHKLDYAVRLVERCSVHAQLVPDRKAKGTTRTMVFWMGCNMITALS